MGFGCCLSVLRLLLDSCFGCFLVLWPLLAALLLFSAVKVWRHA